MNAETILLSIVVPIYNRKKTLPSLMKTLLETKNSQIEILLVNDGSTDGSLDLCNNYANQDSRVFVIDKPNGGVSSARNAGIHVAKGKFLTFFDGDDLVLPDTLEHAIARLSDCEEDLVIFDFLRRDLQSNSDEKSHFILPYDHVLTKSEVTQLILKPLLWYQGTDFPSVWNKFFSTALLLEHNLCFEEKVTHGEDWRFIVDVLDACSSVVYIPEPLYIYQLDGSQVPSKYKRIVGSHLFGASRRKFNLSKKYGISIPRTGELAEYAKVLSDVIFCATNDCDKKELSTILRDPLVRHAACIVLSLNKEERLQLDLTQRAVLDAILIKHRCPFLLQLVHRLLY